MVRYLDFEHIPKVHGSIMARLGQSPQPLVREGDLRSALNRPQWADYYERADVIAQAARHTTGIARAHGFVDGNKRTAYAALMVFLGLNQLRITGNRLDVGMLIVRLSGPDSCDFEADFELEAFLRQRAAAR